MNDFSASSSSSSKMMHEEEAKNVFIRCLPRTMDSDGLAALVASVAPGVRVVSVRVMVDPKSDSSLCYGFALLESMQDASLVMRALHRRRVGGKTITCRLSRSTLSVDRPRDDDAVQSNRLFVRGFPSTFSDEQLRSLFESFGKVTECKVLMRRDNKGNKQIGLVSLETLDEATQALSALHGYKIGHCPTILDVRYRRAKGDGGDFNLVSQFASPISMSPPPLTPPRPLSPTANSPRNWSPFLSAFGGFPIALSSTGGSTTHSSIGTDTNAHDDDDDYDDDGALNSATLVSVNNVWAPPSLSTAWSSSKPSSNVAPASGATAGVGVGGGGGSASPLSRPMSASALSPISPILPSSIPLVVLPSATTTSSSTTSGRPSNNIPLRSASSPTSNNNTSTASMKNNRINSNSNNNNNNNNAAAAAAAASVSMPPSLASSMAEIALSNSNPNVAANVNVNHQNHNHHSPIPSSSSSSSSSSMNRSNSNSNPTTITTTNSNNNRTPLIATPPIAKSSLLIAPLSSTSITLSPSSSSTTTTATSTTTTLSSTSTTSTSESVDFCSLFIAKLPVADRSLDENLIQTVFGAFGEIVSLNLPRAPNGEVRGFAFVTYSNQNSALNALSSLNGSQLCGRNIVITFARQHASTTRSSSKQQHNNASSTNSKQRFRHFVGESFESNHEPTRSIESCDDVRRLVRRTATNRRFPTARTVANEAMTLRCRCRES